MKEIYIKHIAARLELKAWQVENCVEMFADGDTIPFISRYRKEKTTPRWPRCAIGPTCSTKWRSARRLC